MDEKEIREFIKNNLEIYVAPEDGYNSDNNYVVGIRFRDELECFSYETIYIPSDI